LTSAPAASTAPVIDVATGLNGVRGQELVIGGYIPKGDALDSLLVGYYEGRNLMYAASVSHGHSHEIPTGPAIASRAAAHTAMPIRQSAGSR
jgi:hypothetical protein